VTGRLISASQAPNAAPSFAFKETFGDPAKPHADFWILTPDPFFLSAAITDFSRQDLLTPFLFLKVRRKNQQEQGYTQDAGPAKPTERGHLTMDLESSVNRFSPQRIGLVMAPLRE
jgi:hypothetical protein